MLFAEWIRGIRQRRRIKRRLILEQDYTEGYYDYYGKRNVGYRSTVIGGDIHPPYCRGASDAISRVSFEDGLKHCLKEHGLE